MRDWRTLIVPLLVLVASVIATSCTSVPKLKEGKSTVLLPRGWHTYAYGETAISVPKKWMVVHDAVCPATSSSGTLNFGPAAYVSHGCSPREPGLEEPHPARTPTTRTAAELSWIRRFMSRLPVHLGTTVNRREWLAGSITTRANPTHRTAPSLSRIPLCPLRLSAMQ